MKLAVCLILIIGSLAQAESFQVVSRQNLPRRTQVYASPDHREARCSLALFIHGYRVGSFESDILGHFHFDDAQKRNPRAIVLVPNLMHAKKHCSYRKPCKGYDRFDLESYLQRAVKALQKRGYCRDGVKSISLIGHSNAYVFIHNRMIGKLLNRDCSRPHNLLGKIDNVLMVDSLFYSRSNSIMRNSYRHFVAGIDRCNNKPRFVHIARPGHGNPYRNGCELAHKPLNHCNLPRTLDSLKTVQFLNSAPKKGHWQVMRA